MSTIPMIVRTNKSLKESFYFPQLVLSDGSVWRGPCVGKCLTSEQIDYQLDLLATAVVEHDFDPQEYDWVELTT